MRTSKLVINTQERDLGIAIGISLKDYGIARRQIEYWAIIRKGIENKKKTPLYPCMNF